MFPFRNVFIFLKCCLAWLLSLVPHGWENLVSWENTSQETNTWSQILTIEGKFTFSIHDNTKRIVKTLLPSQEMNTLSNPAGHSQPNFKPFPWLFVFSYSLTFHWLENWEVHFLTFPRFSMITGKPAMTQQMMSTDLTLLWISDSLGDNYY